MKTLMVVTFLFVIAKIYGQDCEKGNMFYTEENYQAAIPLLKSCLESGETSDELNTSLLIAVSYFETDKYDSAIEWCDIVLRLDEANLGALKMRAGCYIKQNKYQVALSDVDKLIYEHGLENTTMYYYKGYLNLKLSKLEKALEALKQALVLDENNHKANKLMGYTLNDLKRFDEAIPYLNSSLSDEKELDIKYKQIGVCYYHLNEIDSAIHYLNKAISHANSDNIELLEIVSLYLGMSYDEKGEYNKAIDKLEKLVKFEKYFIEFYPHLAHSYVQVGAPDKAIDIFSQSRQFFPNTPEIFGQIGSVYFDHKQDTLKAREYFLKALNANGELEDSLDFYTKLSTNLFFTKDPKNALRASDVLIENYPDNPVVYKHRVLLLEGIDITNYFDEIVSIFETLQNLYLEKGEKEKASYYLASRALALLKNDDFKRSKELISKAISYRDFPEYFVVRAQVKLFMLEKEVRNKTLETVAIEKQKILTDLDKAFHNNERLEAIYKIKFMSMLIFNQVGVATEEDICEVILQANQKEKIIPQEFESYFCDGIIPEGKTTGEYNYIFELSTFFDYFGED